MKKIHTIFLSAICLTSCLQDYNEKKLEEINKVIDNTLEGIEQSKNDIQDTKEKHKELEESWRIQDSIASNTSSDTQL